MRHTDLEQRVLDTLAAHQDDLNAFLSRLIQFDSQNFITSGREQACAAFLLDQYQQLGLEAELFYPDDLPGFTQHPDYLPNRGTDHRPNVHALWPGSSGNQDDQIMLAAHTDTMPVGDESLWEYDPFSGAIENGRIIGLGSGDNKSGLAAAYWAVKALQACQVRLKKNIILSAYCDEEYGGGNGALASCVKDRCETYVNLDGGNYELWTIALGGGGFDIDLHKTDTTDSLMDCYLAAEALMQELKVFAARRRDELHQLPLYRGSDMERSAFRLSRFGGAPKGHKDLSLGFVIYTDKDLQTIEKELKILLDKVQPIFKDLGIVTEGFKKTTRFFHYCQTDQTNGAAAIMQEAAAQTVGRPVLEKGSCLTDLSLFLKYGSPHSFNFGILKDFALPGGAHQPNEYVDCQEFLAYTQALALFLIRYGGLAD